MLGGGDKLRLVHWAFRLGKRALLWIPKIILIFQMSSSPYTLNWAGCCVAMQTGLLPVTWHAPHQPSSGGEAGGGPVYAGALPCGARSACQHSNISRAGRTCRLRSTFKEICSQQSPSSQGNTPGSLREQDRRSRDDLSRYIINCRQSIKRFQDNGQCWYCVITSEDLNLGIISL